MAHYQLFIHDDRYSVPNLLLITASSDGRAKSKAMEVLLESQNHKRVEVVRDEQRIFAIGAPAETRALS